MDISKKNEAERQEWRSEQQRDQLHHVGRLSLELQTLTGTELKVPRRRDSNGGWWFQIDGKS